MRRLMGWAADLLFPPRCALCGEVLAVKDCAEGLCKACREEIPFFPEDKCPRCGGKTDTGGFCEACLRPFAFESACAAFPYERVRTAIHLFKYRGGKGFGEGLGRLAAEYLRRAHTELLSEVDVMIPVPLHSKKERRRGFNQTILLCRAVSEEGHHAAKPAFPSGAEGEPAGRICCECKCSGKARPAGGRYFYFRGDLRRMCAGIISGGRGKRSGILPCGGMKNTPPRVSKKAQASPSVQPLRGCGNSGQTPLCGFPSSLLCEPDRRSAAEGGARGNASFPEPFRGLDKFF